MELQRLGAPNGQVIYLHGRQKHARVWDRINRNLEDDGYIVFPTKPEPVESDSKKIRETQNERISIMVTCPARVGQFRSSSSRACCIGSTPPVAI